METRELDALLHGVSEARVALRAVQSDLDSLGRVGALADLLLARLAPHGDGSAAAVGARALLEELRAGLQQLPRGLGQGLRRAEVELADAQELAERLRLVPVHGIFPSLERAVRDAAQGVGGEVHFSATGGEVRLDGHVLALLRDALIHVVRNAVAHGIEDEARRSAAGKPKAGQVRLEVERRGGRVILACSDDGRGVDVEAVRRSAVERGVVPASRAAGMSSDEVLALLGRGGLTTAAGLTELSGRGIGLDVARAAMARLDGELRIRSEPGRGATFELQVPISMASLQGVLVHAAGAAVVIPLEAVRHTARIRPEDLSQSAGGASVLHDSRVLPFAPLEQILSSSLPALPAAASRRSWPAVVVHAGTRSAALGVDRIVGTSHVVMRRVPSAAAVSALVAGVALDAEGNPQIVLDPVELTAAAHRGGFARDETEPARAPILVIDDSLTTRMLEQSILEAAGYEVDVASSAEEGLMRARERRYGVFLVDVEMPGMDGFEFVSVSRADPELRDTPAILVTSRGAPEDRRRGEEAGARAYIVKGEFDQEHLLKTIRGLMGQPG